MQNTPLPRKKTVRLLQFTLLLIAVIGGFYAANVILDSDNSTNNNPISYRALKVYPQPKPLQHIQLTDKNEQKLTAEHLKGQWTLLFFGYTYCPDVCPTTMTDMQVLHQQIRSKGLEPPQVLLVSVDPERDTPAQLKKWIGFFNPEFQAATGTPNALEAMAREVGAAYFIGDHQPGDTNYPVDHTAAIFLLDPQARLYGLFTSPHHLPDMVEDLSQLIKRTANNNT